MYHDVLYGQTPASMSISLWCLAVWRAAERYGFHDFCKAKWWLGVSARWGCAGSVRVGDDHAREPVIEVVVLCVIVLMVADCSWGAVLEVALLGLALFGVAVFTTACFKQFLGQAQSLEFGQQISKIRW